MQSLKKIKIKFWGVRGSLARPGPLTCHFGGNTPCVEIRYGNEFIICDTGTGLYNLGQKLGKSKVKATVLFSHYHWDHLLGLPFFPPIYNKKNEFTIIGRTGLKKALNNFLHAPNFPVRLSDFASKIKLIEKKEDNFNIGQIQVLAFDVNHPNGAFGYRLNFPNKKSVVFISDNGPSKNEESMISKIYCSDVLIHDAQYLPKELVRRRRFGHSTYLNVIDLARRAKIRNVVLFHHDPARTDNQIKVIEKAAKNLSKKIGLDAKIIAAKEGLIITL